MSAAGLSRDTHMDADLSVPIRTTAYRRTRLSRNALNSLFEPLELFPTTLSAKLLVDIE